MERSKEGSNKKCCGEEPCSCGTGGRRFCSVSTTIKVAVLLLLGGAIGYLSSSHSGCGRSVCAMRMTSVPSLNSTTK